MCDTRVVPSVGCKALTQKLTSFKKIAKIQLIIASAVVKKNSGTK